MYVCDLSLQWTILKALLQTKHDKKKKKLLKEICFTSWSPADKVKHVYI